MENVTIPTYGIGKPEKNPVFLEKRVYQGSSGVVYPYPVVEKIYDQKENKVWKALFLENDFLKIMILPELGGRVQMAYDKIRQRHFIYYNQVIKPALVGLTGPWISGGIEFNWPQHHRPSTFSEVDFLIEENSDGSKTVWCSELEMMFRTKGTIGFTLYPDKAYLELKVKLYNQTDFPQTFLWWANPAVHVNEHYQSVFPPDVTAVYDHGRRDVSKFPVADGTYYKVDYSSGVDISRYKNIPVPSSFMAVESKYDFLGGYEHDTNAGVLHVADHHVSPGKKQWTWGTSDFGKAWDRNLTDDDGPYIEIMCGVFTDNQPDFSWIMPHEEKSFVQYFMPYREIGVVKNANKDLMMNLELIDNKAFIKLYSSTFLNQLELKLFCGSQILFSKTISMKPTGVYNDEVNLPADFKVEDVVLEVLNNGQEFLSYSPGNKISTSVPEPAKAAKMPEEIESNEQLYLTGLHIEQYRHATYKATDYYLEALRRDIKDTRCNNALGLWLMRRGKINEAEKYFRQAVETWMERNPNPYEGESLYNLGLCLRYQEKYDEAYEVFYKSCWNSAHRDNGYYNLALLSFRKNDFENALKFSGQSLTQNFYNHQSRHLKAIALRNLNRFNEAINWINESLEYDKFNLGLLFEKALLGKDKDAVLEHSKSLFNFSNYNFVEYSLTYANAGLYKDAIGMLEFAVGIAKEKEISVKPTVYYLLADYSFRNNQPTQNKLYLKLAFDSSPDFCFPNRLEEILVLQKVSSDNPYDYKALHYLGNFWFANRQYKKAVKCIEKSIDIEPNFPSSKRNLALLYFNKLGKKEEALQLLEEAYELDTNDFRILMELDQLYKKMQLPAEERYKLISSNPHAVEYRDDLYLELITLENILGNHGKALDLILKRKFHPWEGGEGKVTGQYLLTNIELAKCEIEKGNYLKAVDYLESLKEYPVNLGEGKLPNALENDINFWLGVAYRLINNLSESERYFYLASLGSIEPGEAVFYNDQQPDKLLYKGLALWKLNQKTLAKESFEKLVNYGEDHFDDNVKVDYFAVSLPDLLIWDEDLKLRNQLHCNYLLGLGLLGLGDYEKSKRTLKSVIEKDRYHLGSYFHSRMLNSKKLIELLK